MKVSNLPNRRIKMKQDVQRAAATPNKENNKNEGGSLNIENCTISTSSLCSSDLMAI